MKAKARFRTLGRWAAIVVAALTLAFFAPVAGQAQDAPAEAPAMPSERDQELLIKMSLLSFNDANVTGNYDVFHALLAQPFREQFTAARLKEVFKPFVDNRVGIGVVAAGKPVLTEAARIDERGALLLHGYFDVAETRRVSFVLDFIVSEGDWKLIKIYVDVGKPKAN